LFPNKSLAKIGIYGNRAVKTYICGYYEDFEIVRQICKLQETLTAEFAEKALRAAEKKAER